MPRPTRRPWSVVAGLGTSFLALAVVFGGCGGGDTGTNVPATPPGGPSTPSTPAPVDSSAASSSLSAAELSTFHHMPEGSELYPMAFLLALDDPKTGRPFLENMARFGLIDDPTPLPGTTLKLPVGITAGQSRDLRFANVLMMGVNCSACHVGSLAYQGKPVLQVEGGPNMFDLTSFYLALGEATKATFTDPARAWAFLGRLHALYDPDDTTRAIGRPSLAKVASAQERALFGPPASVAPKAGLPHLDQVKAMGPVGKALADAVEKLHKDELARPEPDLSQGLILPKPPAEGEAAAKTLHDYLTAVAHAGEDRAARLARFGDELTAASSVLRKKLVGDLPNPGSLWKPPAEQGAAPPPHPVLTPKAIVDELADFVETIRLLRARAGFLAKLAKGGRTIKDATDPGPGRVDAFGAARNLIFPEDPAPESAPINFPHLWGIGNISWYHWDGSTTSLLERNVGQALGVGAVFDKQTLDSTVLVDNLETLETLAYRIPVPTWPEAAFGPIDRAKFNRGATVFKERCAECHAPPPAGQKTLDRLYTPQEIGTDANRANNFAKPVLGKPFNVAISEVLKAVIARAGGTTPSENLWRVTDKYAGRPLYGIWAAAPYLHNGSVPTLYHLLLPEDQRPKTFPLGHREYDPKKLGYTLEGTPERRWTYDTTAPGNSNKGHSGPRYGTDLSDSDREAILEYLKANERKDLEG
ncbi:MAG: hypothetical protein U0794_19515 [Isosphaeraceae bacterium]